MFIFGFCQIGWQLEETILITKSPEIITVENDPNWAENMAPYALQLYLIFWYFVFP